MVPDVGRGRLLARRLRARVLVINLPTVTWVTKVQPEDLTEAAAAGATVCPPARPGPPTPAGVRLEFDGGRIKT